MNDSPAGAVLFLTVRESVLCLSDSCVSVYKKVFCPEQPYFLAVGIIGQIMKCDPIRIIHFPVLKLIIIIFGVDFFRHPSIDQNNCQQNNNDCRIQIYYNRGNCQSVDYRSNQTKKIPKHIKRSARGVHTDFIQLYSNIRIFKICVFHIRNIGLQFILKGPAQRTKLFV